MTKFQLNILGCGSASPSLRHLPSCQVIDFRDRLMMIDCGEGAQLSMRRERLKFSRLNHIFISHLHGDHVLGLPGLLSTLSLHEIGGTITVHCFEEGAEILSKIMDFFCRERSYKLVYDIVDHNGGMVYEDDTLSVEAFPLYHRVPCVGYIFREKPKLRHINAEMVEFYKVPFWQRRALKEGADFVTAEGVVIENERLTHDAEPSVSYAYCSDTAFDMRVAEAVKGVDVIYHEATYDDSWAEKAHERGHSTAGEAAKIAAAAGAKLLILGHYSKSYNDESLHLADARKYFPNVIAANEGMKIELNKLSDK